METNLLSKEERLLAVCATHRDNVPKLELSLKEGRTNDRFLNMTEWSYHQMFALKSIFIDKDITEAKQHYYNCGRADITLTKVYDEKLLDYGLNRFSYALLSDSKALIKQYADLKHSAFDKSVNKGSSTPIYAMQCILNDDWTEFDRAMKIMREKTVPRFKMDLDYVFFESVAENNVGKAQEALDALLLPKNHNRRNKYHELIKEFISHPAIGYTKLAWIKGLKVEIDNPLVPIQLMPVEPLETYKEIDFVSR